MRIGLSGVANNTSLFDYLAGIIAVAGETRDEVSQPDNTVKQTWRN